MNQETSSEDRTILAALEALERGSPYPTLPPGHRDEVAETLARLYTEVLGLIPSELEPVAPRPEVKARLMALIAGEETQDVRPEAPAPPLAPPAPVPVASSAPAAALAEPAEPDEPAAPDEVAAPVPSAEPSALPDIAAALPPVAAPSQPEEPGGGALSREAGEGWGGGTPAPPTGSAVSNVTELPARPVPSRPPGAGTTAVMRPASRWPQALAAVLALALLGFSFWLGASNMRQRQTIADLQRQLAEQEGQGDAQQRLREAEAQLQELRTLSQVVQYEVEASPLKPMGEAPMFPEARGVLLVAPDHQHWYMSVRNLGPAGDGRVYQLWFDSGAGMVSGGTFTAQPGEAAELSSQEMPTGIRGVVITLEPGQGSTAPTGPEVLRATNVYPIV